MATSNKASGNFFCVPIGKESSESAKEVLKKATRSARALRAGRRNYQKKLSVKGVPSEVASALAFSASSQSTYHSLPLPFSSVDLSKLSKSFTASSGAKFNIDFISSLAQKQTPSVDAIFITVASKSPIILSQVRQGTSVTYSTVVSSLGEREVLNRGATLSKGEQKKLGNGVFVAIDIGTKKIFVKCREGSFNEQSAKATLSAIKAKLQLNATSSDILISTVVPELFGTKPNKVQVFIEDNESDLYGAAALSQNAYKYFSFEGLGIPSPVASSHLVVPNISSNAYVKIVVKSTEGYGPEFKGLRPPGTKKDFMLAYVAENYTGGEFIAYLNSLIDQDVASIQQDTGNPLNQSDFRLPVGLLDNKNAKIAFDVVSYKSTQYTVRHLAYDRRGDANNKGNGVVPPAGTLVVDEGPFDLTRGVLSDGSLLVESTVRPAKKTYDDRVGAIVPVYKEELDAPLYSITSMPATDSKVNQCLTQLVSYSNNNNVYAYDLQKILQIALYRIDALASGKYKPYVDLATITMMFNLQHGVAMLNAYVDNPAEVASKITGEAFESYRPLLMSPEAWNIVSVRDLMTVFGYQTVNDIPAWPDGTDVTDKQLFAPALQPVSTDSMVSYGLEFSSNTDVVNWSEPSVERFPAYSSIIRRSPANLIVLHWGGSANGAQSTDGGVYRALTSNPNKPKSTHFIVRHAGSIAQHEDLGRVTYHAKYYNTPSIGIDTASPGFPSRISKGRETFTQDKINSFLSLGYSIANYAPLSRQGGIFVAPQAMYENLYTLIKDLIQLPDTAGVQIPNKPSGLFTDAQGRKAVYVTSGIVDTFADSNNPPVSPIGVVPHMYLNRTRTDDIVAYIYYILRHIGDSPADAYRRLVLTLESEILHTTHEGKRVSYLLLSRG